MNRRTTFRCALLVASLLLAFNVSANESSRLVQLINDYRQTQPVCGGEKMAPASPLAPDPTLDDLDLSGGHSLEEALKDRNYRAARAEAISISGPGNANAAIQFMKQHYCETLHSPDYSSIGVSRIGKAWHVVLAQPLLAPDLGNWQQAGREILKLVNRARANPRRCGAKRFNAAPPLRWDARLGEAALAHSQDMARQDYFSHQGKDGSGVGDRATRAGYAWERVGENIAAGQGSAQEAVAGWLASPGHCANLMDRGFREMGAAYALNPQTGAMIYWTQVFGIPAR